MGRTLLAVTLALSTAIAVALQAAEKPSPEYAKAMKDLGTVMQTLSKPSAAEDFELAKKLGQSAKDAFAVVQKYWTAKGVEDASKLAETGAKAAADLFVVANLSSTEGILAALKDMGSTCQACHTAHREKVGEGFEIK